MAKSKLVRNKINVTTQKYLDIAEIKENTVIMRDGTLRSVILVSSINFALKSEDEQNAIISSYIGFLNSIDFPLQIVVQSRELDIESYLIDLKRREREQTNELLKMQTTEYIQYLGELVSLGKIMNKRFYIVLSYSPASDKHKGFFASILEVLTPARLIEVKKDKFLRWRAQLTRRTESVISGLASIGLNSAELDTQGLIELYYNTYNPTTSDNQKLVDIKQLRVVN